MNNEDINYKVTVTTGESGVDANVVLCIFGNDNATTNLALRTKSDGSEAAFTPNSSLEFDLKATDVGKIKKINIGHDGKGTEQQLFLVSVQIDKNDEHYTFTANRWLSEEKDDNKTYVDLMPDEEKTSSVLPMQTVIAPIPKKDQAIYTITVVTNSEDNSGTSSGVLMTIFGETDKTNQFQLVNSKQGNENLFATGNTDVFEMELDDVGDITKINIGHDGKGSCPTWYLKSVQIQKGSNNYNFVAKKRLDQTTAFIDLIPTTAKDTPSPEPVKNEPIRTRTPEQKPPPVKEATYKVLLCTGLRQTDLAIDQTTCYIIIDGLKVQTGKLYLKDAIRSDKKKSLKKDDKYEFQFTTIDVGKVSKIILGQNDAEDNTSIWHVENVTIKKNNETTTFNVEKTIEKNSQIELLPSAIPKKIEAIYKILIRTGSYQEEGADSNLYIVICGQSGQTEKLPLNESTKTNKNTYLRKNDKIEYQFKANDVGKISKITLSQRSDEPTLVWDIDNVTIKRNNETTTFNVERKIQENDDVTLVPSPILKKSETPRKTSKLVDTTSKPIGKLKAAAYDIAVWTGEQALNASVKLIVRGENGLVEIPLTKTRNTQQPFQSNSVSEFTCDATDVGKIRQITVSHDGTDKNTRWHLIKIEIKKEYYTYTFHADVRLNAKDNKLNIFPGSITCGQKKEDYVQSELRRLRESLRTESSKFRRPSHKIFEPFVYNDLHPYFDTSDVEKAIDSSLTAPPGYYSRITALRVVEPWETYAMNYAVNYKLLKPRTGRSASTARRSASKTDDESIDRKQGSTHLPKFPCVSMPTPAQYARELDMRDVPKIRAFMRDRYTSNAKIQMEKDYKRTHDDIYRMKLDDLDSFQHASRNNITLACRSYLENTRGSKKAVSEVFH